jgi:hypothetical protein
VLFLSETVHHSVAMHPKADKALKLAFWIALLCLEISLVYVFYIAPQLQARNAPLGHWEQETPHGPLLLTGIAFIELFCLIASGNSLQSMLAANEVVAERAEMMQLEGGEIMFFEEPRTDGLLRGPRNERKELMTGLGDAPWDLETLLGLHPGLLDHSEEVRAAAMEALRCIAQRKPEPFAVSPVAMLALFMHAFTAASGIGTATFRCLVELGTPESLEAVKAVLKSGRGSNTQFEAWIKILRNSNRLDVMHNVESAPLSKVRRNIIHRVLAAEPGSTVS